MIARLRGSIRRGGVSTLAVSRMTAAIPAMIRPAREKRILIISEEDRLAVDAEDLLERGHDLARGDVRLDAIQQPRHQVIAAASARLQPPQAMTHARVSAPRP